MRWDVILLVAAWLYVQAGIVWLYMQAARRDKEMSHGRKKSGDLPSNRRES